ncbi:hypothetical protein EON66_03110, partial [archaeon]
MMALRQSVVGLLNSVWACASHAFAQHLAQHGGKLRYYEFVHTPSYLNKLVSWMGAHHGAELAFVFGLPSGSRGGDGHATLHEHQLAADMLRLWAEFIANEEKMLVPDEAHPGYMRVAPANSLPASVPGDWLHVHRWPLYSRASPACLRIQENPMQLQTDCVPSVCAALHIVDNVPLTGWAAAKVWATSLWQRAYQVGQRLHEQGTL